MLSQILYAKLKIVVQAIRTSLGFSLLTLCGT
jgi:hypothetical protein